MGWPGGHMKVGILQFFGWRDRSVPLHSVYETALERFVIMDQTGYDAVWLAEHHFSSFSVCPSVHMMGTMAAARTKRLRIGTAVSLAPFYNPLRLAEEVALLDVLSGGRVKQPRVIVEGVNFIKRHTKPNPQKNVKGGIVEREGTIHVSNVMLVDPDSSSPTRVGYTVNADGTKTRISRKSGAVVDK